MRCVLFCCRHWANLEYGCSASLSEVSLPQWNQDEEWGGFGGPHAMVVGGFDATLKGLAAQLGDKLRLSCPVSSIDYSAAEQETEEGGDSSAEQQQQPVKVKLASGEVLEASLVLVTVPLGLLQHGGVEFIPALPEWKVAAAKKLGFGDLNKVVMQVRPDEMLQNAGLCWHSLLHSICAGAHQQSSSLRNGQAQSVAAQYILGFCCVKRTERLSCVPLLKPANLGATVCTLGDVSCTCLSRMQFPEVFWDSSVDYFGITQPPGEDTRGRCFMFWNLGRFNNGAPLLAALVSGRAARAAEDAGTEELQQHMLQVS